MIDKIKSISSQGAFEITLANPVSQSIYEVDSLNLLIGVNGSGKTRTIKSIISDLVSGRAPTRFICEGDIGELGVIYYTSVPFHKEMPETAAGSTVFSDASQGLKQHKNFVRTAQDYVEAAGLLGVNKDLQSLRRFDLQFEIARAVRSVIRRRYSSGPPGQTSGLPPGAEHLHEIFQRIRLLDRRYNVSAKEKSDISDELSKIQKGGHEAASGFLMDSTDKSHSRIKELDKRLIDLAEEKQHLELRFEAESFREFAPQNNLQVALWLTYLKLPSNSVTRRNLGDSLLWNRAADADIDALPASAENIARTILEFEEAVQKTGCGSFELKDKYLTISVNIPLLIGVKIRRQLIEEAHHLDLIEIGFGASSSGEAAIFHQMTSLSHSIRQLFAKGARRFLIFIDEGDMLLHLEWQRRYLGLIDDRLGRLKKELKLASLQVIVATHSPLLATDVLRDSISRMGDSKVVPAFGAPLQKIVNDGFNTKAVGSIAERKIRELTEKAILSDLDLALIEQIDDDFVKNYIRSKKARR
ncbi:hypothetical protein OKW49_005313 [Paraburkholderia youngii]|uniref:hypothetical protein n=1 Tax=Paraburkholderia youngii TaxID=2782701 RepID=UPI003D1AB3F1